MHISSCRSRRFNPLRLYTLRIAPSNLALSFLAPFPLPSLYPMRQCVVSIQLSIITYTLNTFIRRCVNTFEYLVVQVLTFKYLLKCGHLLSLLHPSRAALFTILSASSNSWFLYRQVISPGVSAASGPVSSLGSIHGVVAECSNGWSTYRKVIHARFVYFIFK